MDEYDKLRDEIRSHNARWMRQIGAVCLIVLAAAALGSWLGH